MKNINFEITEEDIKKYLKEHKSDENLKYKEAMFIKYMRENDYITKESLKILIEKYNYESLKVDGVYGIWDTNNTSEHRLLDFYDYLDKIKNLDISGICHIIIPTFGYYKQHKDTYQLISVSNLGLNSLSMNLIGTIPEDIKRQLQTAINDYCIAGKVDKLSEKTPKIINVMMSKEECLKELEEYSYIYGEEPVEIIKKKLRK